MNKAVSEKFIRLLHEEVDRAFRNESEHGPALSAMAWVIQRAFERTFDE